VPTVAGGQQGGIEFVVLLGTEARRGNEVEVVDSRGRERG
jgi:hypothetical protein